MKQYPPDSWQTALLAQVHAAEFWSDSATEDFCDALGIPPRDAFQLIAEDAAQGTPCEGCKHVQLAHSGMYPCSCCSRCMTDRYEPSTTDD